MSVNEQQVRHVARLARLALGDDEIAKMVPELNNILNWVEQLGEVDTDGVEPLTSVVASGLPMRDDVVTMGGDPARVTANAPKSVNNFFVVPKVVE